MIGDLLFRRREFLLLLGGAAAVRSLDAGAQESATPVIGFLNSASPNEFAHFVATFHKGLSETGYAEGKNLAVEYRWAEGRYDRLPSLAGDLARRNVALITATGGTHAARAAKAATTTIPILFLTGLDPVREGLVASFNRPGGNATGVSVYTTELAAKRLELLRELVPDAKTIALLVNPATVSSGIELVELEAALRSAGQQLLALKASSESGIEAAFATAAQKQAGALVVNTDSLFTTRREQLVALAARYRIPTIYGWRDFVEAGGLMSYGPNITAAYHQVGVYAGRILKGAKPDDLPVELMSRVELVINLKTARALGLTVSRLMLARAQEVID